ncbi:D-alanyl-D-alanine carboxypeptidase/D-alanyl-D-alanine endopeptidase [Actinokineospora sp. G85]|uniref:D-alanyl-D-alanine carboxypeptidase/D-alanyl-D-alanine endopeptidase n=1 Tax=Actinokineospora sp. G85 TaxID=3406626 RepID=UPI003C7853BE
MARPESEPADGEAGAVAGDVRGSEEAAQQRVPSFSFNWNVGLPVEVLDDEPRIARVDDERVAGAYALVDDLDEAALDDSDEFVDEVPAAERTSFIPIADLPRAGQSTPVPAESAAEETGLIRLPGQAPRDTPDAERTGLIRIPPELRADGDTTALLRPDSDQDRTDSTKALPLPEAPQDPDRGTSTPRPPAPAWGRATRPERTQITGQPPVPRDERTQASGQSPVSSGERTQVTGQSPVSPGERTQITDQPSVPRDERTQVSGQSSVLRDERTQVSGQSSVLPGERAQASGQPPVSSGERTQVTHQPPIPPGERAQVTDQPPIPRDERTQVTDQPPIPRDERTQVTDQPPIPRDERTQVTDQPPIPRDERTQVTDQPPIPRDERTQVTDQPSTPRDERTQVAGQPSVPRDERAQVTGQSSVLPGERTQVTDQSPVSPGERTQVTDQPPIPRDERTQVTGQSPVLPAERTQVTGLPPVPPGERAQVTDQPPAPPGERTRVTGQSPVLPAERTQVIRLPDPPTPTETPLDAEPARAKPQRIQPSTAEPAEPRKPRKGLLTAAVLVAVVAVVAAVVFLVPGLAAKIGLPGGEPEASSPPPPAVDFTPTLKGPGGDAAPPTAAGVRGALAGPIGDPALGTLTGEVLDPATGEVLFSQGAGTPLVPASTTKLLTSAAALLVLPHADQWVTRVVQGDKPGTVVIVGGGDPTLSSLPPGKNSVYPGAAHLTDLVNQVKATGEVDTVLLDLDRYTGPLLADGWLPDDVGVGYISPMVPAMLDGGRADPTKATSPRAQNPARDLAEEFAQRIGAQVPGNAITQAPAGAKVLGEVRSAPFVELVDTNLQRSDNVLAEALGREVARAKGKQPSFAGARDAVIETLRENGFDTTSLRLSDGSGLSTENRVTVGLLADVLEVAASPDGSDPRTAKLRPLLGALPVAGGSGTLATRYREGGGVPGRGWVRAKTGTLSGVNTLAGVVLDEDGRVLVFALMSNGADGPGTRPALDTIAAALRGCGCR